MYIRYRHRVLLRKLVPLFILLIILIIVGSLPIIGNMNYQKSLTILSLETEGEGLNYWDMQLKANDEPINLKVAGFESYVAIGDSTKRIIGTVGNDTLREQNFWFTENDLKKSDDKKSQSTVSWYSTAKDPSRIDFVYNFAENKPFAKLDIKVHTTKTDEKQKVYGFVFEGYDIYLSDSTVLWNDREGQNGTYHRTVESDYYLFYNNKDAILMFSDADMSSEVIFGWEVFQLHVKNESAPLYIAHIPNTIVDYQNGDWIIDHEEFAFANIIKKRVSTPIEEYKSIIKNSF